MEERQEKLLNLVIENYIETAEPVGSKFLVNKAGLDWSEATVRNELRALEEQDFLTHPHTSAGRIPTTKGYRHYVERIDTSRIIPSRGDSQALEAAFALSDVYEKARKNTAKELVELSEEAVIVAFSPDVVYYTGLSYLFQKPDFEELRMVASVSQVFDRCDECLRPFYSVVGGEPKCYVGSEHPFGGVLSVVASRFGQGGSSLVVLIGPQRMDYKRNLGLMKKVVELF